MRSNTQKIQVSQSSAAGFRQNERHRVVAGLRGWAGAVPAQFPALEQAQEAAGGGGCPGWCWLRGMNSAVV